MKKFTTYDGRQRRTKGETRRVVRETEKHTGSFVLAIPTVLVNISRGFVAIVTLKTIQECCRVCNKSYFFLCLNLRQYDTFVALAIAFNLGRNKLPRPGPFSLGYSFRPALLA